MPISRSETIPYIVDKVIELNPKSILDVGVGFGLYGVLFRAYTDVRMAETDPKRYKEWQVKIDGIEIFTEYTSPTYQIYGKIYYGNALDKIDEVGNYDLIFIGDMIEHLSKEDGLRLITKAKEKGKVVIISTPKYFRPQNNVLGNENERHVSLWQDSDFPNATINNFNYQKVIILT